MSASPTPIAWKMPKLPDKIDLSTRGSIVKEVVCCQIVPALSLHKTLLYVGAKDGAVPANILSCEQFKTAALLVPSYDFIPALEQTFSAQFKNRKPNLLYRLSLPLAVLFGMEPGKPWVKSKIFKGKFPSGPYFLQIRDLIYRGTKLPSADLVCVDQTPVHLADWGPFAKAAYALVKPGGALVLLQQGEADEMARSVQDTLPEARFKFFAVGENKFIVAGKVKEYMPPMIDGLSNTFGAKIDFWSPLFSQDLVS